MRKTRMLLLIMLITSASAQEYKVTHARAIISESNCYSFQVLPDWYIAEGNPAPLFFNFSPKKITSYKLGMPKGGAQISVVAGRDSSEHPASIDQWIELRRRGHSFSSVEDILLPKNTGITRAVKVLWTDEYEIMPVNIVTQSEALFFDFNGHPFAIYLLFNSDDKRKDVYEKTLLTLLEGFRPLVNSQGATKCVSSP